MWFRILTLAVITIGTVACSKAISSQTADKTLTDLAGSEWGPPDNDFDQFVAFKAGGEISGNGGCNNFFGTYELSGETLTIGPLASTKKACIGRMEAESDFLSRLQNARKIEATQKVLSLYGEDGIKVLELQRRDWD